MSDAKKLDQRQLEWNNQLAGLEEKNTQQIKRAMINSIGATLRDLKRSYAKFTDSKGTDNRYSIQQQATRYKELVKASEKLLDAKTLKQVETIYKRDLSDAYQMGGSASADLRKIIEGKGFKGDTINKMPIAAQAAAGERLKAFWTKERSELRQKVTEATLSALQRGKGWKGAQAQIATALRSSGQTILRGRDELSVTARGGIVMNLQDRANLIARTELASAYVQGQMNSYRKNGYSHGRWSATGERTCPFCAAREGSIYRLEDLEGAIPAHPRCRCTVIPVMGEDVERVEKAKDKGAAAALHLDDAGWTAIRQQRFNEYLKFSKKPSLDAGKYLNTPTNAEKFFKGRDTAAVQPAWIPSGSPQPNLSAVQEAAKRAEDQVQDGTKPELTEEEKIAADVMTDTRFSTDKQRTRELRVRLGKAGFDRDQDLVGLVARAREKGALTAEAKAERKDLQQQQDEAKRAEEKAAAAQKKADDAKKKADAEAKKKAEAETKKAADKAAAEAKKKAEAEAKKAADAQAAQAAKELSESQYKAVTKAFGSNVDRAKFDALSASDKKRLYDGAVKKLADAAAAAEKAKKEAAEAKKVAKARTAVQDKADYDTARKGTPGMTPELWAASSAAVKARMVKRGEEAIAKREAERGKQAATKDQVLQADKMVEDLGKANSFTKSEVMEAKKRAQKYVIFDGMTPYAASEQATRELAPQVQKRKELDAISASKKIGKVSKTFKAEEHFINQGASKLKAKDIDDLFNMMESEGGLIAENTKKLKQFINKHQEAIYFSQASLAPKKWSPKASAKLTESWDRTRKDPAWIRSTEAAVQFYKKNNELGELSYAEKFRADAQNNDYYTAKSYNANNKSGGYTKQGSNMVVISDKSSSRPAKAQDIKWLKDAYKTNLEIAALEGGINKTKALTAEQAFKEAFATGAKAWSGAWINTLIHELGHQVHFHGGQKHIDGKTFAIRNDPQGRGHIQTDLTKDGAIFPSKYSATNNYEQFAEVFTTYILSPDTLKKLSPKSYEWIDSHMRNALAFEYE